jgi:hypothetical protein
VPKHGPAGSAQQGLKREEGREKGERVTPPRAVPQPHFNKLMRRKWVSSPEALDGIVGALGAQALALRRMQDEPYQVSARGGAGARGRGGRGGGAGRRVPGNKGDTGRTVKRTLGARLARRGPDRCRGWAGLTPSAVPRRWWRSCTGARWWSTCGPCSAGVCAAAPRGPEAAWRGGCGRTRRSCSACSGGW